MQSEVEAWQLNPGVRSAALQILPTLLTSVVLFSLAVILFRDSGAGPSPAQTARPLALNNSALRPAAQFMVFIVRGEVEAQQIHKDLMALATGGSGGNLYYEVIVAEGDDAKAGERLGSLWATFGANSHVNFQVLDLR